MINKIENLKKLLNKLQHYAIATFAIEVICTVLIGIGASQIDKFLSPWTIIIIFSSFLLIVILSYRYNYLKDFPPTLIDSIKSDFLKQSMENDNSRIALINYSITESLKSLNSETCQVEYQANLPQIDLATGNQEENKLCDKGIEKGLYTLLSSFLDYLHYIIESKQSKFTVGIYLDSYLEIENNGTKTMSEKWNNGAFVLKDDLNLKEVVSKDILTKENISGIELEIQSCLKACYYSGNSKFYSPMREDSRLAVYANAIPLVCDEEIPSGLLFLIGNNLHKLPNDFDDVTKIFNRIIANWINRYNECISHRIHD